MTTYNPNDFSPMSGKEINSQGNVVTPADGINADGSQNVVLSGRKVLQQRVFVSQAIAANGSQTLVVNAGAPIKSIQAGWNAVGAITLAFYGTDKDGNALAANGSISTSQQSTRASAVVSEWGGSPYIALTASDKSAAANTINFVDLWITFA